MGGLSLSSSDDAITLTVFDGLRAVTGSGLRDIAALADGGAFAAAEPAVVVVVDTTVMPGLAEVDTTSADLTLADE